MTGGPASIRGSAVAELRHDLRTPLNHIIGYSEMLMEDAEDRGDSSSAATLGRIRRSARELVTLIQAVLPPSRTQVGEVEVAALRDSLEAPLQAILSDLAAVDGCAEPDLEKIRSAAEYLRTFTISKTVAPGPPQSSGPTEQNSGAGLAGPDAPLLATGRVLIVDDNDSNRELLARRLERQGYPYLQAVNGRQALEVARRGGVDLVLLDVMMPEMNGYDALAAMKSDPELQSIPVIMISGLDEIHGMVRCIEMGAEDFLPKPFDPVLLRARVGASLEKKRLRDEERRKTRELEETLGRLKRTQDQLIVQEKLASLGALTAGIAHEIKNPLNFVTNFAEVSQELAHEIGQELPPDAAASVQDILDDLDRSLGKIREHGKRADSIVRAMLLHSRGQSGERALTDLNTLLANDLSLAFHGLRAQDSSFQCTIEGDYDPAVGEVSVVPQDLSRVFLNIVNNACYAVNQKSRKIGPPYQPKVSVSTRDCGSHVEIRIRDNGPGIPAATLARVFDPFFTTKPAGVGTGLGLSISFDIIVQQHKGELKAISVEGEFTEFLIRLPREINQTEAA